MSWKCLTGAILALGLAATPALACKGKTVLFEDNFKEADPAWATGEGFAIDFGAAKIGVKPNGGLTSLYGGSLFEDADMCLEVTVPEAKQPTFTAGGIVFWALNYGNYYGLFIDAAGDAAIIRLQNGKWLYPVSWRKFDGIKAGAGQVNTLRVTLKGNTGIGYINDKQFAAFKGMPPANGSQFGLHGESEADLVNTWSFSNIKITEFGK
jgi:hypothetical protein